jgi:hypothetical protein
VACSGVDTNSSDASNIYRFHIIILYLLSAGPLHIALSFHNFGNLLYLFSKLYVLILNFVSPV